MRRYFDDLTQVQYQRNRHHTQYDDQYHIGRKRGGKILISFLFISLMVCHGDEPAGDRIQRDGEQRRIAHHIVCQPHEAVRLSADSLHNEWGNGESYAEIDREIHQACDHIHEQLFLISHNSAYYSSIVSTNSR